MKGKGYLLALIVPVVFVVSAVMLYSYFRSLRKDVESFVATDSAQPTSILDSPSWSNVFVAPSGWVIATTTPYVLLTRSDHMPVSTDTELYAYDTFMLVERVPTHGEHQEEWIAAHVLADDPLVSSRERVQYAGLHMYKVVQQAAGAEGDTVNYYYFNDSEAIVFSLYPFNIDGVRNEQGIADLEQVAEMYVSKRM